MIVDKNHIIGRVAEHFVCYDLAKRGIRASIAPFEQAPYDIISEYGGKMVTIQVKGTARPIRPTQYRFTFSKPVQADLIAFVALDLETIHYKKVGAFKNSHWIPVEKMQVSQYDDLLKVYGIST